MRTRHRTLAATLLLVGILAPGCVVQRQLAQPDMDSDLQDLMSDLQVLPPFPEPVPASGSLWSDGGRGAALFRDPRAFRTNDLLTIRLEERSLGTNGSQTDLNRSSEADFGAGVHQLSLVCVRNDCTKFS